MSIKENLLYTAEDSSLQESSALGSRAPLSLMRAWAITAWPAEPLIPETSPSECVELPPGHRASRVPAVPTCRWAGVEGCAGGAVPGAGEGMAVSGAQSLAWWGCWIQVTGDVVQSMWAAMLCWMSESQGRDVPLGV